MLPPAAKLTVETKLNVTELRRHRVYMAQGLRMKGLPQLWYLTQQVNFSMLSALSLHDLQDGASVCNYLGMWGNASQLQFLSVTCITNFLNLNLSLQFL